MKSRGLLPLLAVLYIALPLAGFAGGPSEDDKDISQRRGYYLSLSGGPTFATDDVTIPQSIPGLWVRFPETSLSLNSGYAGISAIGIYHGAVRAELEFSYRKNDIGNATSNPQLIFPGTSHGHTEAFSIMINGYADLPLTSRLSAYGGGGLGVAMVNMNMNAPVNTVIGSPVIFDANSTAFALQAMIGIEYRITRRLHVTGGYRAWTAQGVDAATVSFGTSFVNANDNIPFNLPFFHGPEVGVRFDL